MSQKRITRTSPSKTTTSLNLRVGDWVEVRSAAEILGTLDDEGSHAGLPFMPEMLQYCGKRFRVYKSAHKTCDTINCYAIRRMENAVHLEGLRCDGGAHGGCQAECLLFWKEAWLKRAEADRPTENVEWLPSGESPSQAAAIPGTVWQVLQRGTRAPAAEGDVEERYRCQATELLKATTDVRRRERWDPRFYLKDLTSGNVTLREFVCYGTIALVNSFTQRWFRRRYPHLRGLAGKQTPTTELNLRPGELVRVRTKDEIIETLNGDLRNRGLSFDVEMVPHCGSVRRVLRRVQQLVDEKTGRMVRLPNACLILEDVACSGNLSLRRMFCPRAVYPYWREIWLNRAEQSAAQEPDDSGAHAGASNPGIRM
jgi:hypothetical protein